MALASILIFLAFVSIGLHLSKRDTSVKMHDQVLRERNREISITKQRDYLVGLLIGLVAGFIITGNLFVTIIAGAVSAYVVGEKLHQGRINKRKALLSEQYTQVLSSIISSLEAGSNPYQALEEVAPALKNPARDIFLAILRKNRTGTNYVEAIAVVAEESDWEELKQIEVALRLYDASGSDLVVVFDYLLQAAYENKADRKYVEGITSQIRMTGFVLSGMPFFLMAMMRFMAPEFVEPLFTEVSGIIVVIVIIVLVVLGNKIISKMLDSIY